MIQLALVEGDPVVVPIEDRHRLRGADLREKGTDDRGNGSLEPHLRIESGRAFLVPDWHGLTFPVPMIGCREGRGVHHLRRFLPQGLGMHQRHRDMSKRRFTGDRVMAFLC